MKPINEMNRDELIDYAIKFNIHKNYDFPKFLDTRQQILDKMNELNITIDEVDPMKYRTRLISDIQTVINTNGNY